MKKPFLQFAVNDWLTDLGLRCCHPIARAVWIDLMCIMSQGQPYGHLAGPLAPPRTGPRGTPNAPADGVPDAPLDAPPDALDIGKYQIPQNGSLEHTAYNLIGTPETVVKWAIRHLEERNVFSRTNDGIIFSRRMVRDEKRHRERIDKATQAYENKKRKNQAGQQSKNLEPPRSKPNAPAHGVANAPAHGVANAPAHGVAPTQAEGTGHGVPHSGAYNQNQNHSLKTPPPTPSPEGRGAGGRTTRAERERLAVVEAVKRRAKEK